MSTTLKTIQKEMRQIRRDVAFLRHVVEEDYELSDETVRRLEAARKTPLYEYVRHEDVVKKCG